MSQSDQDASILEAQESLLYSARHGDVTVVKELLNAKNEKKISLDLNCKGRVKSNLGWTPLQLATYFGHIQVVSLLLEAGANVNEVNDAGDTALHKAAFIGNEDLVILLLTHKADVHMLNGEGKTAGDVSKTHDVLRLIQAAEKAERTDLERKLLTAAKEGRLDEINELLNRSQPPSINCVDAQGNTCLHCAAYRGQARVAVLLLQNGIDTSIRNNSGQLAIDLSKHAEIREVLSVRPVQRLQRSAARFEGPLLKRSRFLGWRPVWAVLQRGVLSYYGSRGDAAQETVAGETRTRGARKYLDGAGVATPHTDAALITLSFSDGDMHRLALPPAQVQMRQEWVTALNEHIAYSSHYLWAGCSSQVSSAEEAEEEKPLGSMQDALTATTNSLAILDTQLKECAAIVAALEKSSVASTLHQSAYMRFQHVCGSGAEALSSLRHCAALVAQTRDHDAAKLKREMERNRVLEESLAALARTHHALEMSVAEQLSKSKKKSKTSQAAANEFYDVYEGSDDDTLVSAGALSPWGSPELMRRSPLGSPADEDTTPQSGASAEALSPASSLGTLVSHGGHVYRNARMHIGDYTPSSSQWSL